MTSIRANAVRSVSLTAGRLRPKLMTVSVVLLGLIPVLWATGVGTDVMKPIVLPMIGGVITSSTHILLVTPLIFLMAKEYELRKFGKLEVYDAVGRLVKTYTVQLGNYARVGEDWKAGLYTVKVMRGGEVATLKVVKL